MRPIVKSPLRSNAEFFTELSQHSGHFDEPTPDTNFAPRATERFIRNIVPDDPRDPLLLQVLPQAAENEPAPGFTADPVSDLEFLKAPGLIHKYKNRVLVIASQQCPIHCRYCFRREFPYSDKALSGAVVQGWKDYILTQPQVKEVVFSGGDPLFTSKQAILSAVRSLAELPQLRVVRFHSRVPIVAPELLTENFLDHLQQETKLQKVFVIHTNHVNELDAGVAHVLQSIRQRGFLTFSQSVLLRGVNDNATTLRELFERLVELGVVPYYLNVLDQVAGAQHFMVEDADIQRIYHQLLRDCSGYVVPKLVRDSGGEYKQLYAYSAGEILRCATASESIPNQ